MFNIIRLLIVFITSFSLSCATEKRFDNEEEMDSTSINKKIQPYVSAISPEESSDQTKIDFTQPQYCNNYSLERILWFCDLQNNLQIRLVDKRLASVSTQDHFVPQWWKKISKYIGLNFLLPQSHSSILYNCMMTTPKWLEKRVFESVLIENGGSVILEEEDDENILSKILKNYKIINLCLSFHFCFDDIDKFLKKINQFLQNLLHADIKTIHMIFSVHNKEKSNTIRNYLEKNFKNIELYFYDTFNVHDDSLAVYNTCKKFL